MPFTQFTGTRFSSRKPCHFNNPFKTVGNTAAIALKDVARKIREGLVLPNFGVLKIVVALCLLAGVFDLSSEIVMFRRK